MFKNHKKRSPFLYHLITGSAIIAAWRGIWGLLDIYLFPGNIALSYAVSAIIGIVILLINDFSISELSD